MATRLEQINKQIENKEQYLAKLHAQKKALTDQIDAKKRIEERKRATRRKIHAGALVEIAGLIDACRVDYAERADGLNVALLMGALLTLTPLVEKVKSDPAKRQELEKRGQALLDERAAKRRD